MINTPLYELTVENYKALLETGQGETIYGKSFPKNEAIFKSTQSKYLAITQLYYVIKNMSDDSGASAKDLMEFIKQYGETIADINNDMNNGLITEQDCEDIVLEIDGVNEEDEE